MTHQEAIETLAAERYLLEEMPPDERSAFEEHFFTCEACADDMRGAAAMLEGTRAGFAASRTATPRIHPAWYRSVAIPWAVAATLALVVGYQAVMPSLHREEAMALVPISLHPASRGAEATVPIPRGAQAVTLAIDGIETDSRTVAWTLSSADGRVITSHEAPTPPPGAPLFLFMPAWTLTGSMHYILAFRDAPDPGRPIGEYRFTVSAQ